MAALCKSYMTEAEARRAVSSLIAAGVPADDVRVLMGEALGDSYAEAVGSFAGATGPEGVAGSFAGLEHAQSELMGSFAGADRQRGGSFGDLDRDTVTTYRDGIRHVRIAGHHDLKRMLIEAGLDQDAAERDVRALHDGLVLVLYQA